MPLQRYRWTAEDFVAGELCLEFTNTVGDLGKTRELERLIDWETYLDWALAVGALTPEEARDLRRSGIRHSAQTRNSLRTALEFRATLYRTLSAMAAERVPIGADFDLVEMGIVKAVATAHLLRVNGFYVWSASHHEAAPTTPLTRIVLSTLQLLQGQALPLLRECQRCTWLFIDRSKNHGRRWCRAEACGNRARVERHYRAHAT